MYPLEKLDQLVNTTTNPNACIKGEIPLKEFITALNLAAEEAENIRRYLISSIFAAKEKEGLEIFIHTCQAVCVNLINNINAAINEVPAIECNRHTSNTLKCTYSSILFHLENLLGFIERNCFDYFNSRQKLPLTLAVLAAKNFDEKLKIVSAKLLSSSHDHELINQMTAPIVNFINLSSTYIPDYHLYNYTQLYFSELETILMDNDICFCSSVVNFIIFMNVNSGDMLRFLVKKMEAAILQEDDMLEQIEEWAMRQKEIALVQEKPGAQLITGSPSLKQLLQDAIASEITLLEKKTERQKNAPLPKLPGDDTMLKTQLTVAQLAVLIRLMVDTGIIKCNNQLLFLKMVARSFQTPKKAAISADSLRTKFYTAEANAIDAIKDYLITMMNQLRQYKQ
ncbi:MAG: hypothetical protein JWQ96_1049 [Segetibacter sp.]|nr:hypothetical protein [Segetibacter sp.]